MNQKWDLTSQQITPLAHSAANVPALLLPPTISAYGVCQEQKGSRAAPCWISSPLPPPAQPSRRLSWQPQSCLTSRAENTRSGRNTRSEWLCLFSPGSASVPDSSDPHELKRMLYPACNRKQNFKKCLRRSWSNVHLNHKWSDTFCLPISFFSFTPSAVKLS